MKYNALIPVKSLHHAKSRLASKIVPEVRTKLVFLMLEHLIDVVSNSGVIEKIFVISGDETVLRFAKKKHANTVYVPLKNLNSDLRNALIQKELDKSGAILTISADLPFVTVSDIRSLIMLGHTNKVVLAPSKEGTGTNAILCKPLAIPFLFGKNSFLKFKHETIKKNLRTAIYNSPTIAFDLDTPADLKALLAQDNAYSSLFNRS